MRRHRRRLRGRELKKQKKMVIVSLFTIMLFLTVGYAAFQTTISLNVKGNIKDKQSSTKTAAEVIEELAENDTVTMFSDGNGNIRYTGASSDVHNYICLSETDVTVDHTACQDKHLYRIIGSFSNVKKTESDTTGETRVKVIKAVEYSRDKWDTYGSNNWARPATLNTTLNTTYYDTLGADAKGVIESSLWYLGGNADAKVTAAGAYTFERNNPGYGSNPTTSSGIFALMYPSDYGYASSGCYSNKNLGGGASPDYRDSDCTSSNWLFPNQSDGTTYYEWMLSPRSSHSNYAFFIDSSGYVSNIDLRILSIVVRPTAHLKSSVTIDTEGRDGTKTNPYVAKIVDDGSGGGGGSVDPTPSSTYVYRWSTSEWSANQDISGMTEGTDYVRSAAAVTTMSSNGSSYYLKHKVEGTTVTESYVCFIGDKEYCLRGGKQASEDPSVFYEGNVNNVLSQAQSWFTSSPQNGSCSLNPSGSTSACNGGVFNTVYAYSDGYVNVDSGDANCNVHSGGRSYCIFGVGGK